ncbi:hypothetical protein SAMN04487820_10749 [Actinopolyspora mzabensis]|uniref:Uncharacterized protein n=1 Tax=Actinopolyspora mzabensis TaxID=995066 RepID=A0A1G9BCN5_ACTMZ|nr:hypothetical protein [Actinopolyspora mzabensis]SDK36625.1 hypothetical protein SAMN04487820_10749 [Actinopolyspora mzabensis]
MSKVAVSGVTVKAGMNSALRAALFLLFAVVLVVLSPLHAAGAATQVGRAVSGEYKTEQSAPCESEKLRKRPSVAEFGRRIGRRSERSCSRRNRTTLPGRQRFDSGEDARNSLDALDSSVKCRSAHSQARLQVYRR